MKFTPKELNDNVNVSKTHPLTELLWLVGGMVFLVAMLFVVLGFSADLVATRIPISYENKLAQVFTPQMGQQPNPALKQRLDRLLQALPEDSALHEYDFSIALVPTDDINAVAMPGGRILVFQGLIDSVQSENELAMILAHELGHFAHRDHLRGLGRGLGVALVAVLAFGENSGLSNIVTNLVLPFQASYSRSQETAADQFALDLLNARYGHVGGSTAFFERLIKEKDSYPPKMLASHPHPLERISALKQQIQKQSYRVQGTEPLLNNL